MQDKPKLRELLATGFYDTGKKYKSIKAGKDAKEFAIFALPGDVAGLVYNHEEDKIEMVYKMHQPFEPKHPRIPNSKKTQETGR